MEFKKFEEIRSSFCTTHHDVTEGKMMSSPAIHYKGKVFAFFSRQNNMVFKLGRSYAIDDYDFDIKEFDPFKNKGPLSGWYEVGYEHHHKWEDLASEALKSIKMNIKTK